MSAILLSIVVLLAAAGIAFVNQRSFGRLPRGERLERIRRSPNYRDGQFRNLHPTPQMTSDKGFAGSMWGILFGSKERREPASALPVLKPDLHRLERAEDALVWFGHSSYLLQLDGVRLLVDPVLTDKWPMSLFFSPFKGTDVFSPEDMPDIDCLIVTHDHWDHLDYRTVMQLKERIGRVDHTAARRGIQTSGGGNPLSLFSGCLAERLAARPCRRPRHRAGADGCVRTLGAMPSGRSHPTAVYPASGHLSRTVGGRIAISVGVELITFIR